MKLLQASQVEVEVRKLLASGEGASAAVAYWGAGAADALHIKPEQKLRVACDLRSGACNPDEVRHLRRILGNGNVLNLDRLHAKVWCNQSAAIIGSSNASSNGLCLSGSEANTLIEANVLTVDPSLITEINAWLEDHVFSKALPVTAADLRRADEIYARRRNDRPLYSRATLLAGLKEDPEAFADRRAVVWVHSGGDATKAAYAALESAKTDLQDSSLTFWENAELKPGTLVVEFLKQGQAVTLDGFWQVLNDNPVRPTSKGKGSITLCKRAKDFDGLPFGPQGPWRIAAKKASKAEEKRVEWQLAEFAHYLA